MCRWLLAATLAAALLAGCGPPENNTGGGGGMAVGGGAGGGTGGGGTGGGGNACGVDTWTDYASTWFHDNCSNCHAGEFTDYNSVSASKQIIEGRINSGSMPPGGVSDRQRIVTWFNCDMPQ